MLVFPDPLVFIFGNAIFLGMALTHQVIHVYSAQLANMEETTKQVAYV
jgi:hypothetical protein